MVANVLVQTADAGVASVAGLGDALGNVGPIAAGMGQSLDDTTLALGLMAQAGITGSEAGTNLKSMLLNLSRQTPETTGTLKALGVSLYDATGAMLPLPNILGQLEAGMAGMTDEQRNATMATLAGSYGLNSMRVLLAEGTVGWNEMEAAVASAATVQESAAARTQGFNAAIETMKGVIETLMITALTPLIQNHLTPLIQKFSDVIAKVMEVDPSLIMLAVTHSLDSSLVLRGRPRG
jgi:TP901 family phage tail tape measure protein